jgi:hypothetical protein
MAVKYFMKWVEVKPITNITSATIKNFFWQNIICWYRVLQQITVNNAKYFDSDMFMDFCHQVEMKVAFAPVYHPQSNRTVERTNTLIFEAIKKILKGEKKGKWDKVMPRAVWSHNTTVSRATNFTPFLLSSRVKAVLPKEIKHRSMCTAAEASPCPSKAEKKDFMESGRLNVVANLLKYQDETRSWRDLEVKIREFEFDNLVLLWSPRTESSSKLESKWVGPYMVTKKTRPGACCLVDPQGKKLEHSWNAESLRHFYV